MRLLAAPDKFRGSASALEIAAGIAEAAAVVGADCDISAMADGGEGTLEALGGSNRSSQVAGPLGDPVEAAWRLRAGVAVIEMARASGLELAGGAEANDPVAAGTTGTGELIAAAVAAGARRVIVAVGGSASSDGGLGAIKAMPSPARLSGVEVIVACDVRTRFLDAADVFAPQKGATPVQVELLRRRLASLSRTYLQHYGVDVTGLDGSGAAGGLAGGLAALGAKLVDGFDLVADEVDLHERIERADLVVTGEGCLDSTSFEGKVVGGVANLARQAGVPVLAVVGSVDPAATAAAQAAGVELVDLARLFGLERALADPCGCVRSVVLDHLAGFG